MICYAGFLYQNLECDNKTNVVRLVGWDIDHDGDKDVVIGTYHRDMILVNNGTAAPFSDANQVILPTVDGTDSLQLGDMNNDGLLDLVVGNGTSVSPSTTKNYYYNPWCI